MTSSTTGQCTERPAPEAVTTPAYSNTLMRLETPAVANSEPSWLNSREETMDAAARSEGRGISASTYRQAGSKQQAGGGCAWVQRSAA